MELGTAQVLLAVLQLYAAIGAAFAIVFAWRGARQLEPGAANGTWGFRLLILPGTALLWPWLAMRWIGAARGESVR